LDACDDWLVSPTPPRDDLVAPFHDTVPGSRFAVLVLHGFTGSPASVRPWAQDLHSRGYSVSMPLLPGHGTRWQDLQGKRFQDWYAAAEDAFNKLRTEHEQVFLAGLSMGGTLALALAEEHGRDVAGLMIVNPMIASRRKDVKLLPVLKHVVPAFPAIGNDIKKPGQDEVAYAKTPLKAVASLFATLPRLRERLDQVTQPVILFHSPDDHVVDDSSREAILAQLSSRDFEVVSLDDSYHVATLDNDAPLIFERSAEFIERLTG
jgi:carboxylesterase